jgi:arsenite methyltransferase
VIEDLPVENGWADVVISNGVINLCADKDRVRVPQRLYS